MNEEYKNILSGNMSTISDIKNENSKTINDYSFEDNDS